jgi:hypothetical protein
MTDGFLGRWARRKQEVREGKPVAEPVPPAPAVVSTQAVASSVTASDGKAPIEGRALAQPDPVPLPTLDDVQALTPASDFQPFMLQGVAQDVRNAAVKKLFADPHFNVMDRLDIYIDDYSQPDPLPAAMMRRMASAKTLNLFDEENDGASNTPTVGDVADTPTPPDVAQSVTLAESPALPASAPNPLTALTPTEDAHTDLRLQPDDAPQRESAGPGT